VANGEGGLMERRWAVLAGGGAVAVALAAVIVVSGGDDDPDGGCLPELAGRLPADASAVSATDLDRARDADLAVDGSLDDLVDVVRDTNLRLDPLTRQRVEAHEESTDVVGFAIEDLRCWAGTVGSGHDFVARGSFDAEAVAASGPGSDGNLATEGDLLAWAPGEDPEALLADDEGDADQGESESEDEGDDDEGDNEGDPAVRAAAVDLLDRHDAVTFDLVATGSGPEAVWAGLGLAHDDGWDLLGIWSFPNADEAAAERDEVVEAIAQGMVGDMVGGDPDDLVEQDGATLWMRAPLEVETAEWTRPVVVFDPVLTVVADFADGN
jgi:hypothetical protein